MAQCDRRNLSMMMDLYEMTMANGYFAHGNAQRNVTFDLFYRKNPDGGGFAVFAGLEQMLDMIVGMHFEPEDIDYFRSLGLFGEDFLRYLEGYHFRGDVEAMAEGTIVYPGETLVSVTAPLLDAQLVETMLLAQVNHQSLIATKAARIVRAAAGRGVSDFGARRAHNVDAAVYGARAAYIGGVDSTATVLAGQRFGIPVSGTMAHSWVMFHDDEFEAFRAYAETYPHGTVLLVDTYDVLRSGIPNAIRTAHEVLEPRGERLRGVRIDSGDLAYLSKRIRAMLDEAGLDDCKIIVSNSLDEYTIRSIVDQGGLVDSFGVGERLITAASDPVFGAVYKTVGVERDGEFEPRIKLSEAPEKITNPGRKQVWRVYDAEGMAVADLIASRGEEVDLSAPYRYVDPEKPWEQRWFEGCAARPLLKTVVRDGKPVGERPDLGAIRSFVRGQLEGEIWPEEQRFENPHRHYIDMSPAYFDLKMRVLRAHG